MITKVIHFFKSLSNKSSSLSDCSRQYCADPDNPDALYWEEYCEDSNSRGLSCNTCHQIISSETYNQNGSIEYYMKEFKN